ncbi:MAG TPA: GNAT family N-acetyltransferase [Dehalococcoidia bacterium]|nr:GNAT family N-acetyltransferase [Dehalococcoidia bacterium]
MIEIGIYPKKVTLRDGSSVTLRPMVHEDAEELLQFFLGVPESERWFLKEDVTSPRVIQRWCEEIDYRRALPLLALTDDGRIIADAVLIRRRGGSRSHLAEFRVVVAPDFRSKGLGVMLIRELCDIANDAGIERMVAEMVVGPEDDAIHAAEWLGFYKVATLEGFAKDQQGRDCDVAIMTMPLGRYYEWTKF